MLFASMLRNFILKISMNEMYYLRSQLEHYQIYMIHQERFHNTFIIFEPCRGLVEINKLQHYHVIDMFIHFVMTLLVSIATTKQIFSAMKHVKTMFRIKMKKKVFSRFYDDL